MNRLSNPSDTLGTTGLSERDARIAKGSGIAASIAIRGMSELGPAPDTSASLEGKPAGWDPEYWLYAQQLGCS